MVPQEPPFNRCVLLHDSDLCLRHGICFCLMGGVVDMAWEQGGRKGVYVMNVPCGLVVGQ